MQSRVAGLVWTAVLAWPGLACGIGAVAGVAPADVLDGLRGARIVSVQDVDKINAIDQEGMRGVWGNSPVTDYDRNYARRLR